MGRGSAVGEPATVLGVFRRAGDPSIDYGEHDKQKHSFARERVKGAAHVAVTGLQGSCEWHKTARAEARLPEHHRRNDRAVNFQSARNRDALLARDWPALKRPLAAETFGPGSMGENVYVDNLAADEACIGDVLVAERQGRATGLVLQVSIPRRPCGMVDANHGGCYGVDGVRGVIARTGLGGFFTRVLSEGTLAEGDTVRLAERPHPAWTCERVCALLYGKSCLTRQYHTSLAEWCGTEAELEELASVKELGWHEFGCLVHKLLRELRLRRQYPALTVGTPVRLRQADRYGYDCIGERQRGTIVAIDDLGGTTSGYIAALAEFGRPFRVAGSQGGLQWYAGADLVPAPSDAAAAPSRACCAAALAGAAGVGAALYLWLGRSAPRG